MLASTSAMAQSTFDVSGTVVEKATGEAVMAATIQLMTLPDSTFVEGTTTGAQGQFVFKDVKKGDYTLQVSYIGFVRNMKIQLIRLRTEQTVAFKEEMQEAFQHGFNSYYKENNKWQVLPDKDFYQSLEAEGAEAYEAIDEDGQRLGGAIIAIDAAKHHGELMEQREQNQACLSSAESRQKKTRGQLSFLYVKVGVQSKGIGQTIWKSIEALHPETEVWETCTPYFDRRNIHFYINRLGFHAVEFFNEHHPDPHMPEQFLDKPSGRAERDQEDGLFKFEKVIKRI